jgi:threonine/homoserine/homoserine lactone efflux protein
MSPALPTDLPTGLAALVEPLLTGAAAGYAVAIPVGAIAVLIVETGLRRGLRLGVAAASGAATADGIYATLAAIGGAAIAALVSPWIVPLRAAAVAILLLIAVLGLTGIRHRPGATASGAGLPPGPPAGPAPGGEAEPWLPTYLRLLGLTLLNPLTVVYFAALVLALPVLGADPLARPVFAAGAFGASLSWQLLLAAAGAIAHRRLPARFQTWLSLVGNGVIVVFALVIARDLV